jgi:hypothetical protein
VGFLLLLFFVRLVFSSNRVIFLKLEFVSVLLFVLSRVVNMTFASAGLFVARRGELNEFIL